MKIFVKSVRHFIQFQQEWDVSPHISKIPQYQIWWKYFQWFLSFFICVHMKRWMIRWKEEAALIKVIYSHMTSKHDTKKSHNQTLSY
jgi:hypothetical protein